MEGNEWTMLSIDELWNFHQQVTVKLSRALEEERARLEDRLRKIEFARDVSTLNRVRRPYPKVHPKYRNPKNPAETWAGRGKQPRWLRAQLRGGKKLEDFLID